MGVALSLKSSNRRDYRTLWEPQNHRLSQGNQYIFTLLMGVDLSLKFSSGRDYRTPWESQNHRFSFRNPYIYRFPNGGGFKVLDPLRSQLPDTMGVSES